MRIRFFRGVSLWIVGIWLLIGGLEVCGQTGAMPDRSPGVATEGGFFYARRGDFRTLYGNGFDYGLCYQHPIGERWSWGVRGTAIFLNRSESLKYKTLSIIPFVGRSVRSRLHSEISIGTGFGPAYRQVNATRATDDGYESSVRKYSQEELAPVWLAFAGVDWWPQGGISPGIRLYYDHHFTAKPSTGHFGDTGGFSLMGRLTVRF